MLNIFQYKIVIVNKFFLRVVREKAEERKRERKREERERGREKQHTQRRPTASATVKKITYLIFEWIYFQNNLNISINYHLQTQLEFRVIPEVF